jgi:60 kDa SS-A/Ro ribonucleoprotein
MNTRLFGGERGALAPKANAVNAAGGTAYTRETREALASYALTGTFSDGFYANAETQLDTFLKLAEQVDDKFLAGLAVYARQHGYMKDMPAALLAVLVARQSPYVEPVFNTVIDNMRMLRTFVQIVRSGETGRKSFGRKVKRLIQGWLTGKSDPALFRASVGNTPSVADIIKMVHPKASDEARNALYAYLLDKEHNVEALHGLVRNYEAFKADPKIEVPDVPFRMLTQLPLTKEQWAQIGRNMPWTALRMNLATLGRHEAFSIKGFTDHVANALRDRGAIKRAKVFPYQLLAAYVMTRDNREVPEAVTEALQDAMEIAIENVPRLDMRVAICPDVSGSMGSSVTGRRTNKHGRPIPPSKVSCVHVAGLVAGILMRRTRESILLPFAGELKNLRVNPRDSVMTIAKEIANAYGGATDVAAPLRFLNQEKIDVDGVVIVSDLESWVGHWGGSLRKGTPSMKEWLTLRKRCPKARIVLMDVQAYDETTQAETSRKDGILNVAGFSDAVIEVASDFLVNGDSANLVETIEGFVPGI